MPDSHAKLSPSSSERWMVCAAAPRREAGLPNSSSPASRWGTACHSVLEDALLSGERPTPLSTDKHWSPLDEETQKIGELREMMDTAAVAFDYVIQQQQARMPADVRAESKVNAGCMVGLHYECWGTADAIIVSHEILEIVDLKGGAGVQVEADAPQLKIYAIGALAEYGARGAPFTTVRCTIVQPRGYHEQGPIRSKDYTIDEIMSWCERDFARACAATAAENATATPSEAGCRWCKFKSQCPELSQVSLNAAAAVFQPIATTDGPPPLSGREDLAGKLVREPDQLTPEEIRYILDHEKLIAGWLSAVKTYAKEQGLAGNHIPGYKIVTGTGSTDWAEPVEEDEVESAQELLVKLTQNLKTTEGKRLGKTAMLEPQKLMSPAQAKKRIEPLLPPKTWKKIEAKIVKSAGAKTLAPETDSRPALLTSAKEVFKPISNEITQEMVAQAPDLDFLN